jgi:hypothetical protein
MKTPLLIPVALVASLLFICNPAKAIHNGPGGHHHLNKDSIAKAHKLLIGIWVDMAQPGHALNIKQDSITETRPADPNSDALGFFFTNEYQVDSTAKITVFTEDENGNSSVGWLYVVSVNDTYLRIAHDARCYKTRQYLEVYKRQVKQ